MTATEGERYAVAWIPAGATVHFTAEDIQILPSFYWGAGRGEYIYRVTLLDTASGSTVWTKWNFAYVGIVWGGGPYEWVSVDSRYIGAWTNNTGVSKPLMVKTSAERSYAGAGTRYTLKVAVTGGNGGSAPDCGDDDWVRGSLGPQVDGGAAGDPVNTGSGNFYDTVVDVPRVGALGDALLERTYNAMDPGVAIDDVTGQPGVFGRGWTSWLDTSLTQVGENALVYREPTGAQVDIGRGSDGSWSLPPDLRASLTETVEGRTLPLQGERSVTFDSDGRIVAADDGNGDTVEVIRDDETGTPRRAVFRWHGAERASLSFTDIDADGLVDAVEGPGGIRRAYTYDGDGRLTAVSVPHLSGQPAPAAETYTWDDAGRIEQILTEVGAGEAPIVRVANTYDDKNRVVAQKQADGDTTTFDYQPPDAAGQRLTTVTHGDGESSETYLYLHDSAGRLLKVTDPDGHSVETTWQERRLTTATTRSGATTSFTYDGGRVSQVALPDPAAPDTSNRSERVTYCDASASSLRVSTVTDAAGTVTKYAYGAPADPGYPCAGTQSTPSSVTEAAGTPAEATTLIEYVDGLPTKTTDPDGVVTRFRWDTARRLLLAREEDPDPATAGTQVTFFEYDDAGRLVVTRTPLGIETWHAYDPAGNVTAVTGPVEAPSRGCTALADTCAFPESPPPGAPAQTLTHRRDGSVSSYTDETGRTWAYTRELLDGGGRREMETAPDGTVRTLVFNIAGRPTSETIGDPAVPEEQATTTYEYGPLGRLALVTDPTGVETRHSYDPDGNLTKVRDEHGKGTTTVFDGLGRPTEETDALGNTRFFKYGPTGLLTRSVDRTGAATTYTYDPLGRLLTTTDARGGVITRTYTPAGRLATETDPTNRATSHAYDGAGRLIKTTSPSGAKTTYSYDADGRLAVETSPEGRTTTTTYDAAGRILSIADPRTGLTRWTYNPRGDLKTRTDATGGKVTWEHNPVGRVASVTDPLGNETEYAYDTRGNRVSRTDAKDGVRRWRYDLADRLVTEVDPLDRETTYTYNTLGQLASRLDPAGRTENYGYDATGQLASIDYADGTTTTFKYDPEGRRTSMVDATGTTSWTYDQVGNLTAADNTGDRDLQWAWDLAGRRTVMTYPDDTRYRNTYDADGNLASIQRDKSGSWTDVAVNSWDTDGNLLSQTQPGGRSREWTVDPATGLPVGYAESLAGSTAGATTLTRDAAGRITSETTTARPAGGPGQEHSPGQEHGPGKGRGPGQRPGPDRPRPTPPRVTTDYEYDPAGQLVEVDRSPGVDETFAYDELGRRTTSSGKTTTTYTWDGASQLTRRTVDGVVRDYTYDASGRRTSETWDGGANSIEWTWDARGTLTTERRTAQTGVAETSRVVRGDGRLDQVTTTVGGSTSETALLAWDDTLPVPQAIWSGMRGKDTETRAVYGPDLIRVDCPAVDGCTGSVAHDVYGSALQTPETTDAVRAPSYGPWGEDDSSPMGVAYGFRGELHIGSVVHLRAREYDPATGTFLSPDLLDGVDGTTVVANPYHYADNDPISKTDPTGLRPGESDCAAALVRVICEHQQQILDVTISFAAGTVCGIAAAPAGPFAAGAAGAACGGAVHRALTAHHQGDNPWAAALNPEDIARDAVIGGLTGAAAAKALALARPLIAKGGGRSTSLPGSVTKPRPGDNQAGGQALEKWSWPANRGFLNDPVPTTLKPGTRIDRYGREGGTFVSPEGTPFPQRALPQESANAPYRVYEVVGELEVQGGIVAPWFGQPGGGVQYELPSSIADLISRGILKLVR